MGVIRRHKHYISTTIKQVLIEEKRLNYNGLRLEVNDKLEESREKGVSPRDFDNEIKLLVEEKVLQRTEDKSSKRKIRPVYFTLTENTKREYQRELLGIDEPKERLRKLFYLLLFYEASKAGKITYVSDRDFDNFLKSVALSRQDLKVLESVKTDDLSDSIIHYQPIGGIEVSKYKRKGPPSNIAMRERLEELGIADQDVTLYNVVLPGFSLENILQYHQRNAEELRSALSMPLPSWISSDEYESSIYSPENLAIFSHIEFRHGEIKMALIDFEKRGLIKRIILPNAVEDLHHGNPISQKRFVIADGRLRDLSNMLWELYREKLSKLSRVDLLDHLDESRFGDGSLLQYLFGDENVNKMIRGQKYHHEQDEDGRNGKDERSGASQDREIQNGFNQIDQIKHNMLVHLLIKKHKPLLQQYGLIDLVSMMLMY